MTLALILLVQYILCLDASQFLFSNIAGVTVPASDPPQYCQGVAGIGPRHQFQRSLLDKPGYPHET